MSLSETVSHGAPSLHDSARTAACEALSDGLLSHGVLALRAAEALSRFSGKSHVQLSSNGFSALQAALIALGVQAGEWVALPVVCCASVYHAVRSVGARPYLVDVGSELPLMTADALEGFPGRVVVLPQMFGLYTDPELFKVRGCSVIEDCAQCQRPLHGSVSDIAVYSFSPTKLQTMGYGGAVVTEDVRFIERARAFLTSDDPTPLEKEMPFRIHALPTDFQCAMLIEQLARYDDVLAVRQHWVEVYDRTLGYPERLHPAVPYRYQLLLSESLDSGSVAEQFQQRGVMAWPLGATLLHDRFDIEGDFSCARSWRRRVLSLPLHEGLDDVAVEMVCDAWRQAVS